MALKREKQALEQSVQVRLFNTRLLNIGLL
jgi:hypothetical protein